MQKHLRKEGKQRVAPKRARLSSYEDSISVLLGMLAYCGTRDDVEARGAYTKGVGFLGLKPEMPKINECTSKKIQHAIQSLCSMRFGDKEKLIEACLVCASNDDKITVTESEAIRAIGDSLDCPIPMYQ